MIDGITVLNSTEIIQNSDWSVRLFGVLLVLLIVSFVLGITADLEPFATVCAIISIICLFGLFIIGAIDTEEGTGRYKYEVIMDEDVSLQEVYERYEIKEQRGDIWVLEDKE